MNDEKPRLARNGEYACAGCGYVIRQPEDAKTEQSRRSGVRPWHPECWHRYQEAQRAQKKRR